MKKLMLAVLAGVVAIAMSGCGDNGTSAGANLSGQSFTLTVPMVHNDSLLIIDGTALRGEYRYCSGDSLVTRPSTDTGSTTDTMRYRLSGDTLRMYAGHYSDTLDSSGASISMWSDLVRTGAGTGLIGTWRNSGYSYSVDSGVPTAAELSRVDSVINANNASLTTTGMTYTISFTASTMSETVTMCMAQFYKSMWTRSYDGSDTMSQAYAYDITVSVVGCDQFIMHGNRTNETVTRTFFGNLYTSLYGTGSSGVIYTSSDTSHHSATVYDNPTHCPNTTPTWYYDFMSANARSVPAKRADASTANADGSAAFHLWKRLGLIR
jgi:hypothetical protein